MGVDGGNKETRRCAREPPEAHQLLRSRESYHPPAGEVLDIFYFEEPSGELYLDIGNHWCGILLTELVGESVLSELNDESKGDVVESLFGWWWLCEQHFRARGLVLDDRALDLLKLLNDYFLHGYLAYTKDDPC